MNPPWKHALSQPLTRRQGLRALLAGAALTVPLSAAATPARAAGPNDCRKGCLYTADQKYQAAHRGCLDRGAGMLFVAGWFNPIYATTAPMVAYLCEDSAIVHAKANFYDCLRPGCPGFDPKAAGGPCDGCRDNCCTCQASPTGYICCVFACSDTEHNCCPS